MSAIVCKPLILVAAHEPYWVPVDPLYLPVQVGAAGGTRIPGLQRDDVGENISDRNARYSELTALYWAWKHLDQEPLASTTHIGLAHYRRHFRGGGERGLLTVGEACRLLERAPVLLPRRRNYLIETVESHYAHTADGEHIRILRECVAQMEPAYLAAYDAHMARRTTHICNMLLMRRDLFGSYCAWLFPILAVVDECIDWRALSPYHARAVGRVAERLLDVWLEVNGVEYAEVPMVMLGPKRYARRAAAYLAAKFLGRRYE